MPIVQTLLRASFLLLTTSTILSAQSPDWITGLTKPHDYIQKRVSSYDRSGGNDDFRTIAPGETLTILDEAGPGRITHIWFTFSSDEMYHLKKIVIRMYWDGESTPASKPL